MSPIYKSRLRFCLLMHLMIWVLMLAKLTPSLLDRFNIFILQVEELYIPPPRLWEWVWAATILLSPLALTAIRRNRSGPLRLYALSTALLGLGSLATAVAVFFDDLWSIVVDKDGTDVEKWRTYPIALLWLIFITIAFQVHVFSVVVSCQLIRSWEIRGSKKST
ncbi:JAGN1 [Cordylochernes scorpioides]|uniref:JAGN1 n=1 Tax=Cordylochernes scorpioides TaxID=51811 RepID=A0ABY6JVJ4_9ARAC|nr:JAGN1 [Cordylochernes scorpioides]